MENINNYEILKISDEWEECDNPKELKVFDYDNVIEIFIYNRNVKLSRLGCRMHNSKTKGLVKKLIKKNIGDTFRLNGDKFCVINIHEIYMD